MLGAAYPAAGPFSSKFLGREVFAGFYGDYLAAYGWQGSYLPGWPIENANFVSTPPTITGFGRTPVALIGEEDWRLHAYRSDASAPPGWPFYTTLGAQESHTPAVASVDNEPGVEVFTASGSTTPGVYLFGIHADGSLMTGYPALFEGKTDTFPAIGDVDGDGEREVVFVAREDSYPWRPVVMVLTAATGAIEGSHPIEGTLFYGTAPALADLDQECAENPALEIVVQTEGRLDVLGWDGVAFSNYPGWPVSWSDDEWLGDSSPVIGDVDGDGLPDIAVTSQVEGSSIKGSVRLYSRDGVLHPSFPKELPLGSGGVPAIADVDRDGRNELVVKGSPWDGHSGNKDSLWVYDLHGTGAYGPVHWSQFMRNARHSGLYRSPRCNTGGESAN